MTNGLTELGRQGFLDGSIDWDLPGPPTASAALLNFNTLTDAAVIAITSSTAATPTVILTATTHGLSTGDLVYINGHATNTAANGFWKITVTDTTHFSLQSPVDGSNVVGVAGTGGYCVVYGGASLVGKFYSDFNGCIVGTKVALTTPTVVNGVADAADTTFVSVSGANPVNGVVLFADSGTDTTARVIGIITGQHIVTCAKTTTGTSIPVDPLVAAIPNGTVLKFHTGESATLTALANAGDRAITVTSTTVTVAGRALAPATGSGLPVTPNGGNIIVAWDNGVNKIFKL